MNEKILFITSTRIGDAVLAHGALNYLVTAYPDARITVACGPLVESFYQGVPQVERIIPVKKRSWKRHWLKLWRETVGTRWDIVVDFRNSAVSRLVYGRRKFIAGMGIDRTLHKAAQNGAVLRLEKVPETRIWLSEPQMERARIWIPDGAPVLGIGPTSNWIGKTWPVENFIRLASELTAEGGPFHGWRVAVFGAAEEREVAQKMLDALPEASRLDLIGRGTPADAAACLARCAFYIGNDSGLMHTAAATGIPTLALFGPTNHLIYGPFGSKADYVRTPESMEELTGYEGYNVRTLDHNLMGSLSVESVKKAVLGLADRFL